MPVSTDRFLSGKQRKTALRVAGWILAVAVVVFVSRSIVDGLRDLANDPMPRHWRWDIIAASGALSLVGHVVLVQTWRSMLGCWGEHLPFWSAARVWSVSNLGKYVPGKVWQIGAMSAMSQELGISPIVAPAAALLSTLVSLITGSVVALASERFASVCGELIEGGAA